MFHIQQFPILESTNDYIKQHGKNMRDQSIVWAHKQSKGRGRFEREWYSNQDLTFSILFANSKLKHTILAPLAVVYALQQEGICTFIKWPNDIIYQQRKCAGILIERVYEGNRCLFEVVGIGVNCDKLVPQQVQDKAISLGLSPERLLYRIMRSYQMLLRMDQDSILKEYRKYNCLLGKQISFHDQEVMVSGINDQGELILEYENHQRLVICDEISLTDIYEQKKGLGV